MMLLVAAVTLQLGLAAAPPAISPNSIYQAPLTWTSDAGKKTALSQWAGRKVVLAMVYTSCKAACPLIVQKLKAVQKTLDASKVQADFVVVTLDPAHDTAKTMSHYRHHMELTRPNWTMLVGTDEDTRTLSNLLGFKYRQNPETGEIMHDNKIFLLDERGELVRTLEGLGMEEKDLF